MGKQKAPPPPDYSGIANASAESARLNYQLGQEQLAWAREQYARDSAVTNRVVDAALKAQEENQATALKDRQRYEQIYQPLEDQFVANIDSYRDPAKVEQRAGAAASDVSQQFNKARENAMARLESYGIDPSQTRASALDLGTRVQEASARAGAANQSRLQSEQTYNAMLGSAIDIGKGYPSSVAQQYGTGIQGGNQAANATFGQTASGAQTMGTNTQYQGLGNNALGTWGNALNMGYQNQLARYNANQQSSSGLGGILGLGLGIGTKLMTGGLFEEGGAVPEPDVRQRGLPVPDEASPSRGLQIDDVPAQIEGGIPARLNAGEFIIPEDTVRWNGEKFFQNLIEKSREQKSGAGAKPKVGALPV